MHISYDLHKKLCGIFSNILDVIQTASPQKTSSLYLVIQNRPSLILESRENAPILFAEEVLPSRSSFFPLCQDGEGQEGEGVQDEHGTSR